MNFDFNYIVFYILVQNSSKCFEDVMQYVGQIHYEF